MENFRCQNSQFISIIFNKTMTCPKRLAWING